jgi:hypothetical protein
VKFGNGYEPSVTASKSYTHQCTIWELLTRLIVFIDESGTPNSQETLFSTASVWCVPIRKCGYQNAFSYTVSQLKSLLREQYNKSVNEIHFQDGLTAHSLELISATHHLVMEDHSIDKTISPWNGHPLAYRTTVCSPEAESILVGNNPDYYNALRARSIMQMLTPLLTCRKAAQIEASIILDSEVWKKSLELCSDQIERMVGRESVRIDFSCESSNKVPGLQIADLVAGITRKSHLVNGLEEAHRLIFDKTIHRFQ